MNVSENGVIDMHDVGEGTARASLELLYEIGREIATYLDLRTVLHRVLFLSMKNVGAISGSIVVLDENKQPVESAFLILGRAHDQTALQLRVTYERGMAGWVARHGQAVLIPDTSKDERWLRRPDDSENQTGAKSAVSVPILAREKLVGVITLVHPRPGFFVPGHLELVKAIADQASTAILHAQLFESLQAAHQRYRELFDDSIDPILITDLGGRVLEANRCAASVMGLSGDDLVSLNIGDLHDVDWDKVGQDFEGLTSGETVSYESVLHNWQGSKDPVQVYARSIAYESGTHLQWILRDITERKDLDSLREDLIAMVYHDLRSPLMNVISSLEVLDSILSGKGDETVISLLKIALRSTERVQRLTDSLLDINRLEAGQAIGNRQKTSLPTLVEDAREAVMPVAQSKRVGISADIPDGLPDIFVDADMIRRVIINLLENAIKFTPAEGTIHMGAQRQDQMLQVWVQDSGPGILPADQERIFDKFTRLNTAEGPKGLGLGLAYCRLAVASHEGRIWVESEIGKGSRFLFTVPVVDESGS
ncbi:MAG: GAF domain-containing protein [Anaerolineales bacterium]|nr:GAF domain-containing protein [Anaerolineales bacterium]